LKLRRWQSEAIEAIQGHERPVIWAIMGAGKSITIAEICKRNRQDIIVVTAPTIALVEQLSGTIAAHTGEAIGRWYTKENSVARITVACHASLKTLKGEVDLWIADEAHKSECSEVIAWEEDVKPARRIGFTATPWRSSERESLSLFQECVYEYGPVQALADGVVVIPRLLHPQEEGTVDEQCIKFIQSQQTPGVVNSMSIEDAERFAEKLDVPTMVVHSRGDYDAGDARDFLRKGGARCVVYVNMLAEGFDCPEIMWICARRKVGSRVRFAQEIGRGLRSYPGKTECLVFDPHRLFQRLSLSYEACLGEIVDEHVVIPIMQLEDVAEDIASEIVKSPDNPIIRPYIADYIYELRCELQFRGHLEIKLTGSSAKRSASWRSRPITDKQYSYVRQLYKQAARHAAAWPERVREVLRIVWHHLLDMEQGAIADLISVLKCAKNLVDA
jgi:hypothetical protein